MAHTAISCYAAATFDQGKLIAKTNPGVWYATSIYFHISFFKWSMYDSCHKGYVIIWTHINILSKHPFQKNIYQTHIHT